MMEENHAVPPPAYRAIYNGAVGRRIDIPVPDELHAEALRLAVASNKPLASYLREVLTIALLGRGSRELVIARFSDQEIHDVLLKPECQSVLLDIVAASNGVDKEVMKNRILDDSLCGIVTANTNDYFTLELREKLRGAAENVT